MNDNVFVDSNVFVYARDTAKPDKQSRAHDWIVYLWKTGNGRLSTQVIAEYYSIVTGKLKPGLDKHIARAEVEDLATWNPIPLSVEIVKDAWKLQDRFQLAWWDALIVSTAKLQRCNYLLSEDFQHNQDFSGLRVVNPFKTLPDEI